MGYGNKEQVVVQIDQGLKQEVEVIETSLAQKAKEIDDIATNKIYVKNYGVKADGVTDDSIAFQAALADLDTKKRAGQRVSLVIPPGIIKIDSSNKLVCRYLILEGESFNESQIHITNPAGGFSLEGDTPEQRIGGPNIKNLTIYGANACADLITVSNCTEGKISNAKLQHATNSIFRVKQDLSLLWVENCVLGSTPNVFLIENTYPDPAMSGMWIKNCNIWEISDSVFKAHKNLATIYFESNWVEYTNSIRSGVGSSTIIFNNNYVLKTKLGYENALFKYDGNNGSTLIGYGNFLNVTKSSSIIEYTVPHTSGESLFKLYFNLIYGDSANLKFIVKVPEGSTSSITRVYVDSNHFSPTLNWLTPSVAISGNALMGGIWKSDNVSVFADGLVLRPDEYTQSRLNFDPAFKKVHYHNAVGAKVYLQDALSYTTVNRPTSSPAIGYQIYDTTLNKPLWWSTSGQWRDATGTVV